MNTHDWESVIARHFDGLASSEEIAGLSEQLESDAGTRLLYLRLARIHASLAAGESDEPSAVESEDRLFDLIKKLESFDERRGTRRLVLSVVVAAAMVVPFVTLYFLRPRAEPQIARITGVSGSLIWTGDGGRVVEDLSVGTELTGGTVEGLAPDSWFELQFHDGSTVMISGNSMLTFADRGQKQLRLREGRLSANVVPQPASKPMLIHTRSALLKVLGTQFDVSTDLSSTALNVSDGKVRLRRLSDGSEVDVPAKHMVVAGDDDDKLTLARVPEAVYHWKSQLGLGPKGYGKWLPTTEQRPAALKAIPFVPSENPKNTLYLLSIPVSRSDSTPVVIQTDSQFVVRGRLNRPARIHFGIGVSHVNGEFAGKFRGDLDDRQQISEPDEDGQFEVVYRIGDFSLDPCVWDRKEKLAARPERLILDAIWAFTYAGGPSGLAITEVELISSDEPLNE